MKTKQNDSFIKTVQLIILFSFFQFSVFAEEPGFNKLQGLGETHYYQLNSQTIDQTYHLYVRLPENYESGKKYPTIYLLDGGITFPILGGYYRYLRLAEEIPEMIVVGISYGTSDWQKGNMRSRDFTAKAADRDFWGGAANFQKVLVNEIFSLIEKQYSSDSKKRLIFGQSIGGQFVLYTALTSPDLFWGHIASNPALHRNLDFFIKNPGIQKADKQTKLFVSSGENDDQRFREPALKWMKHWEKQSKSPWFLKTATLNGHSHFSAAPEAFRQGLKWIFSK
ncbi:MAG: alpha/beta hydrolase [Calditrichaeota bacterium]|nr:MAG: alpha/beta hydrolase [Calditrichota bacterium]MBL1204621.1 alpha/beta hydrolase [Calditrichota bacterium]NOG44450.1 alpha/beta hydrolase [Calditrichota bacterium]